MSTDSGYDDTGRVETMVSEGLHREAIGGLWEDLGKLMLDFLRAQGLRPEHRFLDVGCGCLRGGVRLIPYLKPGQYWGIDSNPSLLEAGWEQELGPLGLQQRQPREQLITLKDFEFESLAQQFDYAIAQSVFTHFSWNRIRRCLARLAPAMTAEGRFFTTFFEVPEGRSPEEPIRHEPGGIETYSDRDPYHYRFRDLELAAEGLPWSVVYIGGWRHPRAQHIVELKRE